MRASDISCGVLLLILPWGGLAQTNGSGASSNPPLTETEIRGKGLFLQRCSICHMPKGTSGRAVDQVGPSLYGLFNDGKPNTEAAVRQVILKGGPNMPGFQYGLKPEEIDQLIAYLKTLKQKPAVPEFGLRRDPYNNRRFPQYGRTSVIRGGDA